MSDVITVSCLQIKEKSYGNTGKITKKYKKI